MSETQSPDTSRRRVVVVGNGMVGQRFVDDLLASDSEWQITVVGEETAVADDYRAFEFVASPRARDQLGFSMSHTGSSAAGVPEMSPA